LSPLSFLLLVPVYPLWYLVFGRHRYRAAAATAL